MAKRKPYATLNDIPTATLDSILALLIAGNKPEAETTLKAALAGVKEDVPNFEVFRLEQHLLAMSRSACDLLGFVTAFPGRDAVAYYVNEYKPTGNGMRAVQFVVKVLEYWERQRPVCLGALQSEYLAGLIACEATVRRNDHTFAREYLRLAMPETLMRIGYRHAYAMISEHLGMRQCTAPPLKKATV